MSYLMHLAFGIRAMIGDAFTSLQAREFVPAKRQDDDLFLVEFPKSGVTWLTFLIANTNALLNDDRRSITFFNINDFVPDVQSVRHLDVFRGTLPGYRIFKSHSPHISRYRKVVYLVRDPRHVMVSYWKFLQGLGAWRGTLRDLVEHRRYGIQAWVDHVEGWLDGIDAAASFTLLRYEDLLANTSDELARVYRLLGIPVTNDLISMAVRRSSIEVMRDMETEFSGRHPALKNLEFIRRNGTGGAREPISQFLLELIERRAAPLMDRLGYRSGESAILGDAQSPPR